MLSATVRKFRTVNKEGNRMITRNMDYYNLDMPKIRKQSQWQSQLQ